MQMAALLMGRVRATPIRADTRIPIKKGCISVAVFTTVPNQSINRATVGPTHCAVSTPKMMVTPGVTTISSRVSLDTSLPSSVATTVATSAPTGPPRVLPAMPTVAAEKSTSCGAFKAWAMATPRAAPVALLAYWAITLKLSICSCCPRVSKMVPMSSEAKSPKAIAPRASMR